MRTDQDKKKAYCKKRRRCPQAVKKSVTSDSQTDYSYKPVSQWKDSLTHKLSV